MVTVVELNESERLEELRLTWQLLLGETRRGTFFHSLDWLATYWRHFGSGQRLRVLMVQQGRDTLGILPLVVRTEGTRLGPVRVLTYPLEYWSDFYGPVGPNPAAALFAGLKHVRASEHDWDLIDLRWIDREGVDQGRTERALRIAGMSAQASVMFEAPRIDTSAGWDAYWNGRSAKLRKSLRYNQRRLERIGRLRFEHYRPQGAAGGEDDPRWDLYEACVALSAASWQGQLGTGMTHAHPRAAAFLRELHEVAVHRGAVDLGLLYLDERPVAFCYGFHQAGLLQGFRLGYDPTVPDGAGSLLLQHIIECSFALGDHTFDLGPEMVDYKRAWCTDVLRSYRATHYPLWTARAQAVRAMRWLRNRWGVAAADPPKSRKEAMPLMGG